MQVRAFDIGNARTPFKLIALFCLVLMLYLPVLKAGLFAFDDFKIVAAVRALDAGELLLHLGSAEGRYWRPLVLLSFWFDVHIGNANSSLMHLHNIVLHAGNAALIFLIVSLARTKNPGKKSVPLLAAVLFAIHPVNTEVVSWIAARTDLYATGFALAATLFLLQTIHSKKTAYALLSALCILLGCLAKEVALPLFPAAIVCLFLFKEQPQPTGPTAQRRWLRSSSLPFLAGGLLYWFMRAQAFTRADQSVTRIVAQTTQDGPGFTELLVMAITALGFYLKKVFIPFPLNFAIDQVSPAYVWLGVLAVMVGAYLLVKRDIPALLLLLTLATLAPAIVNAVAHIAWTPYAERYLYLPTALFCICLFVCNKPLLLPATGQKLLLTIFMATALCLSFYRNTQWMQDSGILSDALRQNPGNINLRINHALSLIGANGPIAARNALHEAVSIDPEKQELRRLLAFIALDLQKNPRLAREDLEIFFRAEQKPEPATLILMNEISKSLDDPSTTAELRSKAQEYLRRTE